MTNTTTTPRSHDSSRRVSTETKASVKTTELIAYVVAVVAVLIASSVVGGQDATATHAGHPDPFTAFEAWRLVTFLTIGYMISRGLAKAGSRDFYDDVEHNHPNH
ncbi:MAG: sle [Marmoricola sp.]|nr:sle [Marmoricola sp.]